MNVPHLYLQLSANDGIFAVPNVFGSSLDHLELADTLSTLKTLNPGKQVSGIVAVKIWYAIIHLGFALEAREDKQKQFLRVSCNLNVLSHSF